MIRTAFLTAASMISLNACAASASAEPANAAVLPAHLVPDQPRDLKLPASGVRFHRTTAPGASKAAEPPLGQVQAANRRAMREPRDDLYIGAVQIYPWSEGALYRLYTAPEQVSDIALQPGEAVTSVAAGDTPRWVIGDTTSGTGSAQRTHILVKPSSTGLSTNLVIATDRRVYHVQLESTARTAMTSISWTYPEDTLLAVKAAAAAPVATGVAVDALDFNYRIEGDSPSWWPVRAFDDGRQVFIEFPPTLPQGEAPPLFIRGEGGRAELVNYRLRGRYYVVDRLFAAAELRLGENRQQVVRIVRDTPKPGRSAS